MLINHRNLQISRSTEKNGRFYHLCYMGNELRVPLALGFIPDPSKSISDQVAALFKSASL